MQLAAMGYFAKRVVGRSPQSGKPKYKRSAPPLGKRSEADFAQLADWPMKLVQFIKHQDGIFYMNIHGIECCLRKIDLYTDSLMPLERSDKKSTIGWYVNRKFVSYWQIKKAIKLKLNKRNESPPTYI